MAKKKAKRTIREFTPTERKRWEDAKNEELAGMAENIESAQASKQQALQERARVVVDVLHQLNVLKEETNTSLADLMEMTGMSRSSLSRLLSSGTNPQLLTLDKIARSMGKCVSVSLVDEEEVVH